MTSFLQKSNEIFLQTDNESQRVELRDIENSGTDYIFNLIIKSGGFGADCRFEFNEEYLNVFLVDLQHMEEKLVGRAELKAYFGENQITLEVVKTGQIEISGHLDKFDGEFQQSLSFCLITDQTVLKPLINDFNKYLRFG